MTKPKATNHKRTPLEQLRLDRDWTYRQLGDRIYAATGVRRTERCIARACHGRRHRETFANAIEKFLAAMRQEERAAARQPASPAKAEARA